MKIKSRHQITVSPEEFSSIARGYKYELPSNDYFNVGDQILIKEHNGNHHSGYEITGEITKINTGSFTFRKWSVTYDESLGKENTHYHKRRKEQRA